MEAIGGAPNHAAANLRPWARLIIGGIGELGGELVGFSHRIAVVALEQAVDVGPGRAVLISLGIDDETAHGLPAAVLHTTVHSDGRCCVAVELADADIRARRRAARVPFAAKIEAMVVTGRVNGDPRIRGNALDLSVEGLAMQTDRELQPRSVLLLRFALPPHRGTIMQVRSQVSYCRPDGDGQYLCGFVFQRVSAGQLPQLQAAVVALRDAAGRV